ncbi:hypothetical protein SAMN05421848_1312 [Kushneria avicenniae]|uniref:Uncharacterized protein n=1 Tax=Kushneria avicenniae TaxID=402385 RepID=A0A1I1J9S1_9GAMM|nr:hypothetical protein [Kushneria avicenniae]SFC42683.1 hypothetical protein SAMN05421848_1312 [Kushneria avicenniae]
MFFKSLKVLLYIVIGLLALIGLMTVLIIAGVVLSGYADTGHDCADRSDAQVKRDLEAYASRHPESFSMEGYRMLGERRYTESKRGDILAIPFETTSGRFTGLLTCQGHVELSG